VIITVPQLVPVCCIDLRVLVPFARGAAPQLSVEVQKKEFCEHFSVIVVKGKVPSLFGRDWLQYVKLQWSEIFHLSALFRDVSLLSKHEALFKDGVGTVHEVKAEIHVDPQAKPKYFKPHPVAYALRQKVKEQLDRLLSEGKIHPVDFSEWATPAVPIVKSDGTIRICESQ